MSSLESFDGLCGIIHLCATSDQQVRCKYEFGHSGPHSWDKIEDKQFKGFFLHTSSLGSHTKK